MDFDLSPEQQQIHKLANEFADREIAPGALQDGRFIWQLVGVLDT